MRNINLLIIDDELGFYSLFRTSLIAHYAFEVASTVERGLTYIAQGGWDAVLLDLSFHGVHAYEEGLNKVLPEVVKQAKGNFPIIVATSDNREKTEIIANFKEQQEAKPQPTLSWEDKFVTADPNMEEVKKRLRKLGNYAHTPVLLLGETGVGKEISAKYLHDAKNNPKLPFKAVNLSGFNQNLVESEIFGHIAGAFTGATKDKKGFFEEAKGGTLFLDEIGEISLELQTKLLRVIQERKFQKVGSTMDLDLDAHLVFATNRDLDKDVLEGRFRQDFYERIKTITIEILPLRERSADILPLIERFLKELCIQSSHPLFGKSAKNCFTPSVLEVLHQYRWPSNIRELRNTIEQLLFEVDVQDLKIIDTPILPLRFKQRVLTFEPSAQRSTSEVSSDSKQGQVYWSLDKQTAYHELEQIEKALIQVGGRKDDAAKMVGIKDDQLLRYKVKSKYFREYPELFANFPIIKKIYKL
jgi:DNA-binding NtrC family response regulator